jgi:hypothetical protein
MAVFLSPVGGAAAQFFTNNGIILSGGKLYTYAAGTTTPAVTYTSSSGATPHSNPIILNSAGRVATGEIWLDNTQYKFLLKDSNDVLIATWDNITGINDFSSLTPIIYNATGNGSNVAFNLASAPTSENTTQVYVNGVYQQKNTYTVSGVTLTFSQAPPLTSLIEVMFN